MTSEEIHEAAWAAADEWARTAGAHLSNFSLTRAYVSGYKQAAQIEAVEDREDILTEVRALLVDPQVKRGEIIDILDGEA